MLKKVAIFKALDVEIKKQRGSVAVKEAYRGHHSLREELSQAGISVIAEVAGGDPGRGKVRESYKASTHARSLAENGAKALSIATDRFLYHGEDKHLSEARTHVKVPLLRREFIFEEYQVEESKILGADAIFLMPALLAQERFQALLKLAKAKNLDVAAEVSTEAELKRALEAGADLICVVGRDLDSWQPNLDRALALLKKVPNSCLKIVEAGVQRLEDIKRIESAGAHGVIVGDALLDDFYPGKRLSQLLAGVEPPKKPAKAKAKAEAPAGAAPAATGGSTIPSTSRAPAATKAASGATSKPSARATPSTTARKGEKEPRMADMPTPAPMAAPAPAAKKPAAKKRSAAKKKAAPKKAAAKKPAAKKKAAPKKAAAKKAAPKRKTAAKKAAPKRKTAAKKAAPKRKTAAKKAAPKRKATARKAAPKRKAAAKK